MAYERSGTVSGEKIVQMKQKWAKRQNERSPESTDMDAVFYPFGFMMSKI